MISLISNTSVVGGTGIITTSGIDTTGADFIVLNVVYDSAGAVPTVSDSKSNTWTGLTVSPTGSAARLKMFYTTPSSVGASHTFTANGNFSTMEVASFSGLLQSGVFDKEIVNSTASAVNTFRAGNISADSLYSLIISAFGFNAIGTPTSINSGFIFLNEQNFGAGNNYGSALAYKVVNSTAVYNPTWTRTGTADTCSSHTAIFKGVVPTSKSFSTNINGGVNIRPRAFSPGIAR